MDANEFRKRGREMVDFVADYLENIRDRRVTPEVKPGYIRGLIPDHAPEEAEEWKNVFQDIERVIMPGITHWHSPQFHAYYPAANSYPSILADMLSDAIGCIGFSWASSPACTELEVVVLDWLAKMIDLPEHFLSTSGKGGGVIQGTASEATLVALLSARAHAIHLYKQQHPGTKDGVIMSKMVAYSSDQAHSSVERAGLIAGVKMRSLESDESMSLRGVNLQLAMEEDKANGLIPMFVCATLGTTPCCAFDNVPELGAICQAEKVWLHIDAAYAGSSFICPEFRPLLNGVEFAESYNFNPHKWLNVTFDCSAMWIRDSSLITEAFNVDPLYLKHDNQENTDRMPDYRHWQIPLGRRFRSLKLWFVLRLYGQEGLREYIRKDVRLAHEFESCVKSDDRFQIVGKVVLGLVCFRLKQSNEVNERLLKMINQDGRIHMVPSVAKGDYFLRFAICASRTESRDVHFAWKVITELTDNLLKERE